MTASTASLNATDRRRFVGRLLVQHGPRTLLAALLLVSSSCQSAGRWADTSPPKPRGEIVGSGPVNEPLASPSGLGGEATLDAPTGLPPHEPADGVYASFPTNTIYDALVERRPQPAAPEIHQASAHTEWQASRPSAEVQPIAHAAVARTPLEQPGYRPAVPGTPISMPGPAHLPICPPGSPPVEFCPPGLALTPLACPPAARPFPHPEYVGDEFICDGGDKHLPVHYNGVERMGLDTEDTIAEWVDHEGEAHVKATNRVCVYAPRFGAVRSATLPEERFIVDRALGHQDRLAVIGYETKTVLDEKTQTDEVKGMLMRSRASGLNSRSADNTVHQAVAAQRHVKLLNLYEDFQFVRDGLMLKDEAPTIGEALAAAWEWTDDQRVMIIAHDKSGQIVQGRFTAQDFTGVEDQRTKGELVIVKLADRKAAKPGDEITFTLRLDNVGGRELFGVRVVDNISPRLEFIEGSVESNLDGRLDVELTSAGGQLLTFEFEEPLAGKTGGWVSFKCRVR